MFNNKELKEFEKFLNCKERNLKMEVGRTMYVEYSFYTSLNDREKIIDIISLFNDINRFINIGYDTIETPKIKGYNLKFNLQITFEKCYPKEKRCFIEIAQYIFNLKSVLDVYSNKKAPKSFLISCLFYAKKLQEYDESIFSNCYTKYSTHVNYILKRYRYDIQFKAYTGNVEALGLFSIYYEIVNNMIEFNNFLYNLKG